MTAFDALLLCVASVAPEFWPAAIFAIAARYSQTFWRMAFIGIGVPDAARLAIMASALPALYSIASEAPTLPAPTAERPAPLFTPAPIKSSPALQTANELLSANQPQRVTTGQLFRDNCLGEGRFVLGIDADNQPIYGDWRDVFTVAVGGLQGSGKSTTARFLICQAALNGARIALIDPHKDAIGAAANDSLAASLAPLSRAFVCQPSGGEDNDVLGIVRLIANDLQRRKSGEQGPKTILVVDEFSTLMRRTNVSSELSMLLEDIASQGRKFGIFAMLLGQQWHVSRSGGGELRGLFAAVYCHRIKRQSAMMLLEMGHETPKTSDLRPGEAWLYRTNGDLVRITVPNCGASDIETIARALPVATPELATNRLQGGYKPTGTIQAESSQSVAVTLPSGEATQAAQLFLQGKSPAEIVTQLRGVSSHQGGAYQKALNEVLELIRIGVSA